MRFRRSIPPLALLCALPCASSAAAYEAKRAEDLLLLDGDQTGNTIKVAADYLPERWNVATAIYAKGKPKFILPPGYRVASDGDGWWSIGRRRKPMSFAWTGDGADAKWDNPKNWSENCIPGRLDTIRLGKECAIDMGRDRMVSNIVFTAKVILGGGAIHAQNTTGRGASAKLGVRAGSCLGRVETKDAATVAPLRGTAGYRGILEEDGNGISRIVLTRPSATFVWTGAAKDGKWSNEKNWLANGRPAAETPVDIDQVVFSRKELKGRRELEIEMPEGLTAISNLVAELPIKWMSAKSTDILGDGGGSNLDILDISGNESFTVRGDVRICIKGGAENTDITADNGTVLALAAHNGRQYRRVTLEDGAELIPYDWVVEIDKLVIKGENTIRFWPPRKFNRFRPMWMIHAKHLEGNPNIFADDMAHWGSNVEHWNDGSHMLTIFFK